VHQLVRSKIILEKKEREKEKKRKNSADSDNTASLIKGGGYVGACTRQKVQKIMWVRGVVCRSTQTQQTLAVVACVVLQCIPCFL
jgi:hypothetical protein